jgi:hypothetical protein
MLILLLWSYIIKNKHNSFDSLIGIISDVIVRSKERTVRTVQYLLGAVRDLQTLTGTMTLTDRLGTEKRMVKRKRNNKLERRN